MPLPDERPRQSVANLIGRFEKQKSSSGAPAPPPSFPRTSSVVSHRTGDSAQEELKERREWPPKAAEKPTTSVSPPIEDFGKRLSSAFLTPPVPKERSPPSEPELPSPPAEPKPPRLSPPAITSPVQPTPTKAKSPPPQSQTKSTATRTAASAKSPLPKTAAKSSTSAPIRTHASGGSVSMSSTPLKPQHTGQSTASTGAGTRAAAKPRAAAKTPAAATPARAKTPLSTTRPKTPTSTARPKTPSSTTRPKTPSGLYAPTAASLARSRGGAPAPPPVEKPKRKITTDLSKPTAASASRMRSPAPTPARGGKTPVSKTPANRAVAKPPSAKGGTPSKRPATVKPGLGKMAIGQDNAIISKKAPSGTGPTVAAGVAATGESDEAEVSSDVAEPGATDTVEAEMEEFQPDEVHEDVPVEAEHLNVEEGSDSPAEEIESYDEDFPVEEEHEVHNDHHEVHEDQHEVLEGHHEVQEEHTNGGVGVPKEDSGHLDEGSLVEEPEEDTLEQKHVGYEDDNAVHGTDETHETPEEDGEESPSTPHPSHDVSADLHHSEDIVGLELRDNVEGKHEEVMQAKVGNDLEDIVNLLESGPTIQRPSVEAPRSESAVSEAGEIPDEY